MNPDLEWSIKEKLAIASYVFHTGDQHWTGSVSRLLRPLGDPDRPPDWFSPKHCAQQYTALVETAENTRRKRPERSDSNDSISSTLQVPTPSVSELVLRKVTQERIEELKKLIRNEKAKFKKISHTVEQLESGELNDKVNEMYEEMQRQIQQDEESKKILGTESSVNSAEVIEDSQLQLTLPNKPTSNSVEQDEVSMAFAGENGNSAELRPCTVASSSDVKEAEEHREEKIEVDSAVHSPHVVKELSASPATSSSRTLPTPTPVIESDSSDVEDAMIIPPDICDVPMKDLSQENEPKISPHTESSLVTDTEPPKSECTVTETNVASSQAEDTTEEKNLDAADADEPMADESQEQSVETFSPSTASAMEADSTLKSEVSESQPVHSQQDCTPVDICTAQEAETFVESETREPTQSSLGESKVEDVNSSQEKTAIETPDVSVIEGVDPLLQKTVSDERPEEESYEFGSNVSSTPAYIESFPNSPALSTTSDVDPEVAAQHRAWKKSIVILWKQVASHRYASLFLHPVTNEIAPNYSSIVLRPMDLTTLKKNVENGVVRSTSEFQRDLMLMFQNALMYNNCEHDVYKMTQEMQKDVMDQVEQFLATQLMMETAKLSSKGLRRSTLRKSVATDKTNKRGTEDSKLQKK